MYRDSVRYEASGGQIYTGTEYTEYIKACSSMKTPENIYSDRRSQ